MIRNKVIYFISLFYLLSGGLLHTAAGLQHQGEKVFLIEAAQDRQIDILKWLLKKGAYVDQADEFGRTALMTAAAIDNGLDVAKILVDAGADITLKDRVSSTALHIAVAKGRMDTTVYLKDKTVVLFDVDNQGRNVIHLAAEGGYQEIINIFLSNQDFKIVEKMYDNDGFTPLHYAARSGHVNVLELFKNHSLNMNLTDKNLVGNLLTLAATNNQTETVKFLIDECQMKPDVKDSSLRTPLHLSSMIGNTELVTYLIEEEVDINDKDIDGKTPLHLGVEGGYSEIVKVMLKNGAMINTTDKDGNNLLHAAAMSGNMEVLNTMLNTYKDVKEKNNLGATPLILASEKGHMTIVQYLVLFDDDVRVADSRGYNSLHAAAVSGNVQLINYLLSAGVTTFERDESGMTALHYASENGNVEAVKILIDAMSNDTSTKLDCIQRYKLTVNVMDKFRRTPSFVAAAKGHIEVLNVLHMFGADFSLDNVNLTSPFQVAASNGKVDILKFLAMQGVDLNKSNNENKTAIYMSAEKGQLDSVLFLVDNSADLFTSDVEGKTAMHAAAENGHSSIVKILGKYAELLKKRDNNSRTPGWYAASRGFFELVQYFLKVVDIGELGDLLLGAVEGGHLKIVKYLLWNEAYGYNLKDVGNLPESLKSINNKDFEKYPLYIALNNNHNDIAEYFIEYGLLSNECSLLLPLVKLDSVQGLGFFLARGCDINMKYSQNNTLLDYATEFGSVKVLEYLLGKGADPNIRNEAFEKTINADKVESLKVFLKHGFNLNYTNSQRQTLVHIAAREGAVRCLQFFIDSGLNIDDKDLNNKEPFHYALSDNRIDNLRVLLKAGAIAEAKYDNEYPLWKTFETNNILAARCLIKYGARFSNLNYNQRSTIENCQYSGRRSNCHEWNILIYSHGSDINC